MFSWGTRKAIANFEKHRVSFEEAATIFADPEALDWQDLTHSNHEIRYKRIGLSTERNVLLVIYTYGGPTMAKKRSASLAHAPRAAKNGKPIPDSQIDFTDIPESTDQELRRARRVGRPKTGRPQRQMIALRIDPALLKKLRDLAAKREKPYQTFIHELLERAAKTAA